MIKGIDYLYQKGITETEFSKFGLAYLDSTGAFYGINSSPLFNQSVKFCTEMLKANTEFNALQFYGDSVIIPIQDMYNNIISLAFRKLSGNSPCKFLGIKGFKKTSLLFGLNNAYESILEKDEVFIVEGYWEVIILHKFGIENVVALCGCSIRDNQIAYLSRFTHNFNVLLDPDKAGDEGSVSVAKSIKAFGNNATILKLDAPLDLDEYIKNYSIERFLQSCGLFQKYTPKYQK